MADASGGVLRCRIVSDNTAANEYRDRQTGPRQHLTQVDLTGSGADSSVPSLRPRYLPASPLPCRLWPLSSKARVVGELRHSHTASDEVSRSLVPSPYSHRRLTRSAALALAVSHSPWLPSLPPARASTSRRSRRSRCAYNKYRAHRSARTLCTHKTAPRSPHPRARCSGLPCTHPLPSLLSFSPTVGRRR